MIRGQTYLEVVDDLAQDPSKEPGLRDVDDDGRRQTDEDDEEVSHGQIDDEEIGDGPHLTVPPDDEADEGVPYQSNHEDDEVEKHQDPLERRRKDVASDHLNVVLVTHAVIVRT